MSKVTIEGNASGTGTFTIAAPNSNTDRTLTLPNNTGTAALIEDFEGANLSLSSSGYQILPSGLILQWITRTHPGGSGSQTVTFPIAFPNEFFGATFGIQVIATAASLGTYPVVQSNTLSGLTYFINNGNTPIHTDFIWFWGH